MRWAAGVFTAILLLITAHFAYGTLSGGLDEKSIAERLKPEALVTVVGSTPPTAATAKVLDIGEQRYEDSCKMCHETGLAGAPKFGDKSDWAPRIAKGMDVLLKHAVTGFQAMPPKGGCSSCEDEEIHKAVEFMVKHSK